MIERTKHGIFIPSEDIPALAGMIGGFKSHMEDMKPEIPGSFKPFYDHLMDMVERLDIAVKTKPEVSDGDN